jgi:enterochelin esterase-like enzyme
VDEDFMTNWVAETGDPGEFFQVDLGKVSDIYAIQCNFDHVGAQQQARGGMGMGMGAAPQQLPEYYQCFYVEVSIDGSNWTKVLDKSENKFDLHHDYNEFLNPVQGRYVRVTNARECHDGAKFCMKDLRIFGNPYSAASVKVGDVKVVRNPEDRREASLLWEPIPGADGYIVRYGIEPNKLYNSYILYDDNKITIRSLNTDPEYFFEVESFDSGLDYYREVSEQVNGTGGEIELNNGNRSFAYSAGNQTQRFMIKEGVDEYVFENITPGSWTINHTLGPVLWSGTLTEADLIGEGESGIEAKLTDMGVGTLVNGEMVMRVIRGKEAGKIVVNILHDDVIGGWFLPGMGGAPGGMVSTLTSPVVNPDNTVTFNFRSNTAQKVQVSTQFAGTQDMEKRDGGLWTVTLGPVEPDMYPYSFIVDGVQTMDPLNPDWFPNETFKNSIVDVRGQGEPLLHALTNVPHGAVDYVNYWSESLGTFGNAIVYTPPSYYKNKNKKYPVFYLISGTTDTEEVYYKVGRMNLILDNLVAQGKAKEMIIVLPYGNPSKYFPAGKAPRMGDMFTKDLIDDLMPYVEKNYRTINDRDHRAIGGFSRGGNQGLAAGLTNLDKFSWLCSYSSFTSTTLPGGIYDDPNLNDKIHLFWLGVGTDDFLYGNAKDYMDFLDSKGIKNVKVFTEGKFGHTWMNAKYFLDQSFPLLFQD